MKILITSIGSLVGQNILDALEKRRDKIYIVGINSIASNPRNFRCDKVYHTPEFSDLQKFEDTFLRILQHENPDLIIPSRDEDVISLSRFKEKFPEYADSIPVGKLKITSILFDKLESYQFAKKNQIPFAETFYYSDRQDLESLTSFVNKFDYPLIIKPRAGSGSRGVSYIINDDQLNVAIQTGNFIIQEYLGSKKDFIKYEEKLKTGIPLYFDVPDEKMHVGQVIISPLGKMSKIFCSILELVRGYPVYVEYVYNKEIEEIVKRSAEAIFEMDGYGVLNVQLKKDKKGSWKIFEFNLRFTAATSARYLLGFDEIGILSGFLNPELKLTNDTQSVFTKGKIYRDMVSYLVMDNDVDILEKEKVWERKNKC